MKEYLYNLLSGQLSKQAMQSMDEYILIAGSKEEELKTYQSFAKIPSLVGKGKVTFTPASLQKANELRKGWNPENMFMDQAARILLLLSLPTDDPSYYLSRLKKFFEVADMSELTTLCLGLPLYPFPDRQVEMAKQGLRSNIKTVFEAVAANNPFPSEYFDIEAWNQMVLKALFVESPVYKIYGIDARVNSELARMLCDYAHERWAAGRIVNPELWRCVGPFIDDKNFNDITRVLQSEDSLQQEAGALACYMSKFKPATDLLNSFPHLKLRIESNDITWDTIGKQWYKLKETA
jgi:hypothetical protein